MSGVDHHHQRTAAGIRQALRQKVGLSPSAHWSMDCVAALSARLTHPPRADDVMQQVLYHDLRDVVREFENNDDAGSASSPPPPHAPADDDSGESAPAVQLRRAIQQSQDANHGFRAHLPESFGPHLVQLEEVLDVSANALSRLQHGPSGRSGSAPGTSYPAKRCLKIAYVDGYHPRGGRQPRSLENEASNDGNGHSPQNDFVGVALEVEPLPDLSVQSYAGLKVRLQGPMEMRRGVALWHAANAAVIGGSVPRLVQIQRAALEQAARVAGVGVDPTVRALIGNTADDENSENEADEGEHASSDVPPVPVPVPPVVPTQLPTPTLPPPPPPPPRQQDSAVPTSLSVNDTASFPSVADMSPPAFPPPTNPRTSSSTASTNTGATNDNRSHSPMSSAHRVNPYASTRNPVAAAVPPTTRTSRPPESSSINPYFRTVAHPSSFSHERTLVDADISNIDEQSNQHSPPINKNGNDGTCSAAAMDIDTSPGNSLPDTTTATTTTSANISYNDLYERLLQMAKAGPGAWPAPQEWHVQLQRGKSARVDFNIVSRKTKLPDGTKRKDYEYWLLYKFTGPHASGDAVPRLVTCRLDPQLVTHHFGTSAADLRHLRRTQATAAQQSSVAAGQRIAAYIGPARVYQATLIVPPEDFWQSGASLDGKHPLLVLRPV